MDEKEKTNTIPTIEQPSPEPFPVRSNLPYPQTTEYHYPERKETNNIKSRGAKKWAAIATVGGIICLIFVAIFVAIIVINKNGANTPEDVADKFMVSFNKLDIDGILETMPKEFRNKTDENTGVQETVDSFEELKSMMKSMDFSISSYSIQEKTSLDAETVRKEIEEKNGVSLDVSEAVSLKIAGTMNITLLGETMEEPLNFSIVCAKIKNRWYVIDSDNLF